MNTTVATTPAATITTPCPVHPWCAVPHDTDPTDAEHFGTDVTVTLPGGGELFTARLQDMDDVAGPEASAAGVDCADLTADELGALIGQLAAALPRLRAMHAALTAPRATTEAGQ